MTKLTRNLAALATALIVTGFLQVWLPHPAVGITQLGIELGEWTKFIQDFRYDTTPINRNFFYLPPICLALSLIILALAQTNWRGLLLRGGACAISLLAIPPLPVLLNESSQEWRTRILWIIAVFLAALLSLVPLTKKIPAPIRAGLIILLCLIAIILPFQTYETARSVVSRYLDSNLGYGVGLYLNSIGFGLMAVAGGLLLRQQKSGFR